MGMGIHLFFIMIRIITHSKFKTNAGNIKFLNRGILSNLRKMYCRNLHVTMNGLNTEEAKQKLGPEKIFFEGPPSKVELIIPFFFFVNCKRNYSLYYHSSSAILGKL